MHNYYRDCTNERKPSWNERKPSPLIPIMICIALTVTGLCFPSWHMYNVIDCVTYLAGLAAIFLTIPVLFVLVWALTRFMMKGEN